MKALNNLNNIRKVVAYLSAKEDSEEYVRIMNEILVYCTELEVECMRESWTLNLEKFPKSIRIRMAIKIHDYVRNWLIANRKI